METTVGKLVAGERGENSAAIHADWSQAVHNLARIVCARHGLPQDQAEDLGQEALKDMVANGVLARLAAERDMATARAYLEKEALRALDAVCRAPRTGEIPEAVHPDAVTREADQAERLQLLAWMAGEAALRPPAWFSVRDAALVLGVLEAGSAALWASQTGKQDRSVLKQLERVAAPAQELAAWRGDQRRPGRPTACASSFPIWYAVAWRLQGTRSHAAVGRVVGEDTRAVRFAQAQDREP